MEIPEISLLKPKFPLSAGGLTLGFNSFNRDHLTIGLFAETILLGTFAYEGNGRMSWLSAGGDWSCPRGEL
jgi:hypothetical protein